MCFRGSSSLGPAVGGLIAVQTRLEGPDGARPFFGCVEFKGERRAVSSLGSCPKGQRCRGGGVDLDQLVQWESTPNASPAPPFGEVESVYVKVKARREGPPPRGVERGRLNGRLVRRGKGHGAIRQRQGRPNTSRRPRPSSRDVRRCKFVPQAMGRSRAECDKMPPEMRHRTTFSPLRYDTMGAVVGSPGVGISRGVVSPRPSNAKRRWGGTTSSTASRPQEQRQVERSGRFALCFAAYSEGGASK